MSKDFDHASLVEGIAERYTSMSDQERGHLMDAAGEIRRLQQEIENSFSMLEYNGIPRVIPGLSGPPSLRSAIDRLATRIHRDGQRAGETLTETREQLQQSRDMLRDCHTLMGMIARYLEVKEEPHQNFEERLLEAAKLCGEDHDRMDYLEEAAIEVRFSQSQIADTGDYDVTIGIFPFRMQGKSNNCLGCGSTWREAIDNAVERAHGIPREES